MAAEVTVVVVPVGRNLRLLDCTECGPIGTLTEGEVSDFVYEHLGITHNCNMDAVDIKNLE